MRKEWKVGVLREEAELSKEEEELERERKVGDEGVEEQRNDLVVLVLRRGTSDAIRTRVKKVSLSE